MTTANRTMNIRVANKLETVFEMLDKGVDIETIAKWAGVKEGTILTQYRSKYNKARGITSKHNRHASSFFKKVSIVKIDSEKLNKFENVIIDNSSFPIIKVTDDCIRYVVVEDGELKVIEKSANEFYTMKAKFS